MANINNKKQLTTFIILFAVIIIILNIVSRKMFFRIDVTDNNIYSLSNSSKSVIKKLDDRIVAKVFFSENIPGQLANSRRYLQDLLEEYQAYSNGNFHFELISPDDNEDAQKEAQSYRIPPVQMQVVENDKIEIKNAYMGLVLLYNDKQEAIPVIQTSDGLEYTLTAAIKKISATDLAQIGVVSDSKTENPTTKLEQELNKIYSVRQTSLDSKIPQEINTILMNGVTDSLSLDQLYNLDQFILRGGRLFIGQSRSIAHLQKGIADEIKSNIFPFLEHYGIKIGRDMLTDKKCGQVQVQRQMGIFNIPVPINYQPFLTLNNFNTENLIVKNLEEVRIFFAHEVFPANDSVNFTSLIKTSNQTGSISPGMIPQQSPYGGGYSMAQGYNIRPHNNKINSSNPALTSFPLKNKNVVGLVDGFMTSFFKDSSAYNSRELFLSQTDKGQILLVGDNQFFNDQRAGGIPENLSFIMNSIDFLAGDQELLEIRSRGITARPLDELPDSSRRFWKWLNVILPSFLVILLGLYRMKRNKDKRNMLEEIYG